MRRLTLLFVALAIAIYAFHLIATTENLAPYILRDGLLLAAVGALIFTLNAPPPQPTNTGIGKGTQVPALLVILIVLAVFLRLWRLTQLPLDCIDAECDRALALAASTGSPTLFNLIAHTLSNLTGQNLLSLRLTSALVGILTIPIFFATASRWSRAGSALLATTLFALNPWHIWASRTSDPWITLPLLLCLLLWALAILSRNTQHASRNTYHVSGITLLCTAIILTLLWNELRLLPWHMDGSNFSSLLSILLHGSQQTSTIFLGRPLLGALPAALALVGLGYALRYVRQRQFALLLASFILLATLSARLDLTTTPVDSLLLALLPFFFLLAALALDPVLDLSQQTWRSLIVPGRVLAVGLVLLLIAAGRSSFGLISQLDAIHTGSASPAEAALGRFLARQVQTTAATIFAPAAVLDSPATRLLAGSALENGQVRPLERAFDDLLYGASQGDLLYLIPADEPDWRELLRRFFPSGDLQSPTDEADSQPLFFTLAVSAQENADRQGLPGLLLTDSGTILTLPSTAQLQFDWQAQQPLTTTFQAQWEGALLVPVAGQYRFAVQGADSTDTNFILRLDNAPVLDSAQGYIDQSMTLAKGFYRIDMHYRNTQQTTGNTPPLTVRWQRPGAGWQIIPRQALRNPPAPNLGLMGTYYPDNRWQGATLDQRKDLLITPALDVPMPYSVRWQGKVGAPRSGEYLFATHSDGINQLLIDGQLVVDAHVEADAETVFTEGLIFLRQGWHELELRYAPASERPMIQLRWQPPGSGSSALSTTYLAPILPGADPGVLVMPPAPPLLDASLGDDQFALAQMRDAWQPQVRIPPSNLSPLPFTRRWLAGNGCGAGDDQLNQPHGLAINAASDQIYVADTANLRVAVFTLNGMPVGFITSELFQEPFDLHLAIDGTPLLLDAVAQQVFQLDPAAGTAEPLALAASFYRPRGFALDAAGNLMVADTGGARVAILQANGEPAGQFGGPETPVGKGQPVDTLWANGRLWTITAEDGRLWRLDNGGSLTAVQPTNTLNGPHLVGLPDGSFFVSDPGRGLVFYYAANAEPRGQLAQPGVWVTPTGVDAVLIGDQVYLAVADSATCTLSFWQAEAMALP